MSRTLGEVVRRGADNVLANWPLLLIRIAESVAMIVMVLGIIVLAVMPVVAAGAGGSLLESFDPAVLEEMIGGLSIAIVVYAVLVISVAMLAAVIVHSFVQAGIIGCYLAADERAPDGAPRSAFAVFTPELWWQEARENVWRFFWIYNIAWGAWSLVILLPLAPLALLIILTSANPAALVFSIIVLVALLLFAFALAFVVFVWSQVVLIDAVRGRKRALEAIREGGDAIRGRLGNVILVAGIFFAISGLVGSVVAGFSISFDAAGVVPGLGVALIPFQILLSLVNTAVSVLFGSWMIAALVAALTGPKTEVPHAVARV